jgi:hypothetical protein
MPDHLTDTAPAALDTYLEMLRGVPGPTRLLLALKLSALTRNLAWAGAVRHSGPENDGAVVERFLTQLYGTEIASRFVRAGGG